MRWLSTSAFYVRLLSRKRKRNEPLPMRRSIPLVWLTLLLPLLAAGEPTLPGVGEAMQTQVAASEVAGVVTLVTTKDEIIHWEATGLARLEPQVPMRPDDLFWLASTSKIFAGVAVLMLQDEGQLNVADPVAKYLPELAGLKTEAGDPAVITITQLLSHMSGLADIDRTYYAGVTDLAGLMNLSLPLATLVSDPGQRWKYNNFEYDLAGRIVEVVSGKCYDAFLSERLLVPLGMVDTTFYPDEAQQGRLAANYAKNRKTGALDLRTTWSGLSIPVRGKFPPVPGGGLFSTAPDLAKFCRMLLNRGSLDGRRYLSEESYALLTTIQTGQLPTAGRGWGLGPYILRVAGDGGMVGLSAGSFGHPGALGTHLIIDPEKGLGYVMLLHRSNLRDNFENEPMRLFVQAVTTALVQSHSEKP